ncbi:RING finger and CHY zinc finger domain-containing protein 1 isoform X2 [Agrilus planipennis]|nr:RING finger and CHY zinc finger domain-containing protein 1 isoform X2 [Agrilus planipennis]XP_025836322.1 RING finger and CHY zinc finger domain-containing protein 1 isoform X2 [Agrilus planipennis]XP_025836323.1 RING finger and CHY zinc finger domain-containing protein 1 isoform X2 [Agrilus planipennis]XP_025836325.1 RING finger and CHY zinc finger domain-containing protein 1 isoform X2 [Agrilus planipennis]
MSLTPRAEGPPEEAIKSPGCAHYKRKSKFVTPCCNKVYTCRFCHDEREDHTMNRKEVSELICTLCDTRQPVQAECQNCGIRFGKYTCLECNLFDDEDKNQYHCNGCGICRIGGADKFFHCKKCNMCLPVQLQNRHKCVENVSRANCPVCLEDIHTSRTPCHIPNCGHLIHRVCFEQLLQAGHYACPVCQTSLMDMTQLWKYLDNEVARTPMPAEYSICKVDILCKDCHKESTIKFHVVGLKCSFCGSYNTCRSEGPSPPVTGRKISYNISRATQVKQFFAKILGQAAQTNQNLHQENEEEATSASQNINEGQSSSSTDENQSETQRSSQQ